MSAWTVGVAPDYGPVRPDFKRAANWDEMVALVRSELQAAGERAAARARPGDENAAEDVIYLLEWLDKSWREPERCMRSRNFYVGRDSIGVQIDD